MLQTFWGETTGAGAGDVNEVGESPDDAEGTMVSVVDEPPEVCGASAGEDSEGTTVDPGNGANGINVRSDAGRDVSIISGGRAFWIRRGPKMGPVAVIMLPAAP